MKFQFICSLLEILVLQSFVNSQSTFGFAEGAITPIPSLHAADEKDGSLTAVHHMAGEASLPSDSVWHGTYLSISISFKIAL